MKQKNYLAFDFGAGSGRAIVGILYNNKLKLKEIYRFKYEPSMQNSHLCWPFDQIIAEIKIGIKRVFEQYEKIESLGVDTWGVDFGLLDAKGQLLELPVTYRDSRTDGMIEEVYKKIKDVDLYRKTGNQTMQYNSLFQLYSIKLKRPDFFEKIHSLLFMPDLINYFLTDRQCSEYTISSTSQLLDAFTKNWSNELFQTLGMSSVVMNKIVFAGEKIGSLKAEFYADSQIDVIAVGSHDTASAVAAIPAGDEPWAFLSSGTWSLIGCELPNPHTTQNARQDGFTNEGCVDGKIRFLQNVMGMWLLEECRKIWKKEGSDIDYATLLADADKADPFRTFINPDDSRFFNPDNMITAIDNYCLKNKQFKPQNVASYTRAILESLALKYRNVIEKLNAYREKNIETIHIVGGGSQNNLLNQFTANSTGLKVIAGPVEATAIGNIVMQAIANGDIADIQTARKIVKNCFEVKVFYPQNMVAWNDYSTNYNIWS